MTFGGFVEIVAERLSRRAEDAPEGTFFAAYELVADVAAPEEWVGQAAKLLEYRLRADCLYSSHGTPYLRPASGLAWGDSVSVA